MSSDAVNNNSLSNGRRAAFTSEFTLRGRPVSRGLGIGKIICLFGENRQFYRKRIEFGDVEREIRRFGVAHRIACRRLERISSAAGRRGDNFSAIFDVHLSILEDSSLRESIEKAIRDNLFNAEWAVKVVTDSYIAKYRAIPDEHFRDRYIDVEDIAEQLQAALGGGRHRLQLEKGSIVAARELRPSTLAELAINPPAAIITETGGWTSHTFILARELEIPAVTGLRKLMRRISSGNRAVVDAYTGTVIINPTEQTIDKYANTTKQPRSPDTVSEKFPAGEISTLDGRNIAIRLNFDVPASFYKAKKLGAQGIGLYRSEYLFNRFKGFPSELVQARVYREIAEFAGEYRARIRTFDLTAGQTVEFATRRESNPALGLRAIRLSLTADKHFRTQIRALLQAAYDTNIDIILPMVSGVDEILAAKAILREEAAKLAKRGVEYGSPRLGAMIEVPSAVLCIRQILDEVDTILLGTNDLVQYILAVDRDNEAVSGWFRTLHPAVLLALKTVIEAANNTSKPVVVCGEMAGSPFYVPILVGLGAGELSMNLNSIARVRRVIEGVAFEECRRLANTLLASKTADEAESVAEEFLRSHWSHLFLSGLPDLLKA